MSKIFSEKNTTIKAIIIGVISSAVVIAILMSLLSLIFLISSSLPSQYLEYITLASEALGVAVGSYIASRVLKRQGLFIGLIVSSVIFLSILIAGFCDDTESLSVLTPIRAAVLLLCGALSGIAGVNKKEKLHIK